MKLATIVLVTRNRKGLVLECLRSVFSMNYTNFKVVLVDNASSDGSQGAVKKAFPQVILVEAKENLGLNGGKNLGQKYFKGDYLLFLDSDTVVDKSFLSELVKTAELDRSIGIVCPKMYYYDEPDVIWYAGSYVNLVTSQTKNIGCNEKDKGQYDQVRKTQFAPTAYLATRESVEKLKGHNEDLFMTYGDTDYGFRAMEAGFKVMFCPKAKLWHHLSKNANNNTIRALGYNLPMRAYYFARNRVIFMKRHASLLNYLFFLVFIFPVITLIISFKIITLGGSLNLLKIHLLGSFDGYRFAFGASPKNIFK